MPPLPDAPSGALHQPAFGDQVLLSALANVRLTLTEMIARTSAAEHLAAFMSGGKLLRATLVLSAAELAGSVSAATIRAAVAIELLHAASLLHDDIVDGATMRRGLPALRMIIGDGRALIVGDELLLCAVGVLSAGSGGATPTVQTSDEDADSLDAVRVLMTCARRCCHGQYDELGTTPWISKDAYLEIAAAKTAAPFEAACELGVLTGGGAPAVATALTGYARALGIAYQITDDLRDLAHDTATATQHYGHTLGAGRPSYPLVLLWHRCTADDREALRTLQPIPPALLRWLLDRHQIAAESHLDRTLQLDAALHTLSPLPPSAGRTWLARIVAAVASHDDAPLDAGSDAGVDLTPG